MRLHRVKFLNPVLTNAMLLPMFVMAVLSLLVILVKVVVRIFRHFLLQ
ncbi:hypothetical protein ALQ33_02950 [Pseudomonas syringae pv. philadelphi]|uniref:Uncharacterized protein n=1 Tax=Pseudomonas syringae pv. philadelphi TaxID=251706 RepID=A0A3M3YTU3_9PSED|nr:hypothetical protein ALQ33_02950 [Pseudomonas syringae pv. philadelphi]